jgi:hypothetical protein
MISSLTRGAVGVGRVDEVDSQFHGAAQYANGLRPIRGLTPNSFARDPHRAESQARDAKIISDDKATSLTQIVHFD